jgi:hypothetical protein
MSQFEIDDILVYSSSLDEGKSLGTARLQELVLVRDLLTARDYHPNVLSDARKRGQTVGKRKLGETQDRVRTSLNRIISQYRTDRIDEGTLRYEAAKLMKGAWRDAFLAGVRAGGAKGEGAGKGKTLVRLDFGDDYWFRTATAHEMRYLNKFMDAVVDETWRMPLERRVEMYVNALESFYNSARVIGLPGTTLLHWVGPADKKTCPSCRYLFENSPYTKFLLPCTPKNGMTVCLTNCRDRIVAVRTTREKVAALEESVANATRVRNAHIRALRAIKRGDRR